MWECRCGLRFKDPDIGITCPACGSENIVEIGDNIDLALDSFGIIEQDYEEAGLEIPEHQNCSCTGNDYARQIESTPLSFDDMEINEICLLDLETNDRDCEQITFFTDMNSRFLRTFLGEPVWA